MIGPVYLGPGPHEEPRLPGDGRRRRRATHPDPEEPEAAEPDAVEEAEQPVRHISVEG